MKRHVLAWLRPIAKNPLRTDIVKCSKGNIAVMTALALVPILGLVGAAIDYTRASALKSKLLKAADAAALAAVQSGGSDPQKYDAGLKVFKGLIPPSSTTSASVSFSNVPGGIRATASGTMQNSLLAIIGISRTNVTSASEAVIGSAAKGSAVEIALALDNTGSMANNMGALRSAATSLVNTVMTGSNVKVSVVPFVAAVNVGPSNLPASMIDVNGDAQWHAIALKRMPFAYLSGGYSACDVDLVSAPEDEPASASASGSGGSKNERNPAEKETSKSEKQTGGGNEPAPASPSGPGAGRVEGSLKPKDFLKTFAKFSIELFGVKPAHADVTPNTRAPLVTERRVTNALNPTSQANLPQGFIYPDFAPFEDTYHHCFLYNPPKISHVDLFKRIPGASWKGCVEARAEPYDVTDDVPSAANPETLFTPYFWPDEISVTPARAAAAYSNSYMNDQTDLVWPGGASGEERQVANPLDPDGIYRLSSGRTNIMAHTNLFKYNGLTPATIKETAPNTSGPNKSCPDALLRLTNDKAKVLAKIGGMSYWSSGGTIVSEGLMWAWRTLSPKAPFSDGADYQASQKFIVLMTDGINELSANTHWAHQDDNGEDNWRVSDYTAYGYLGTTSVAEANKAYTIKPLDSEWDHEEGPGRFPKYSFSEATNYLNDRLKKACENAQKQKLQIYTVLFTATDPRTKDPSVINLMKQCASKPDMAYTADNQGALITAFEAIGKGINADIRTGIRLAK